MYKPGPAERVDGTEARIYATDGGGEYPIHGAILVDGSWEVETWTELGRCDLADDPDGFNRRDLKPPAQEFWILGHIAYSCEASAKADACGAKVIHVRGVQA